MTAPAPAGRGPDSDRIVVELPAGGDLVGVARLVLGGLASRFELPVDRVEELLLAVDCVVGQDGAIAGDAMRVEALAGDDGLSVILGPYARPPLAQPGARRVVEALVDAADENGADGEVWVRLHANAARVAGRG